MAVRSNAPDHLIFHSPRRHSGTQLDPFVNRAKWASPLLIDLGDFCAIQFAVTKLFGIGSQVSFLATITSRYRKLMVSITERVISGQIRIAQITPVEIV
jgi:hypothetical protein